MTLASRRGDKFTLSKAHAICMAPSLRTSERRYAAAWPDATERSDPFRSSGEVCVCTLTCVTQQTGLSLARRKARDNGASAERRAAEWVEQSAEREAVPGEGCRLPPGRWAAAGSPGFIPSIAKYKNDTRHARARARALGPGLLSTLRTYSTVYATVHLHPSIGYVTVRLLRYRYSRYRLLREVHAGMRHAVS